MNKTSLKWQSIFIHTERMSFKEKEELLRTNTSLDPDIVMLHKIVFYEESIMNKGTHRFYGLLLQIASQEVMLYIKNAFGITNEQIETTVEKDQKMLQNVENVMKSFCDKLLLDSVDKKYGQLRWALIKDDERYKSNVITVWTSIFSFFWLLSSTEEIGDADIKSMIVTFHTIVGYDEFRIFAFVCLCAHRLFCVLPHRFAYILELAVAM
jgi:hypothetical protein